MAARLVLVDREGRPRLIAEAFLRQGGTVELSLRILDRQGNPRLVGGLFVHRDGTGEVAVAVLDRHGTARAVSAFFLLEDGTLEIFIGFHRIRHHLYFTARRAAFPALPDDTFASATTASSSSSSRSSSGAKGVLTLASELLHSPSHDRAACLVAVAGGWRLVIAAGSGLQARHGRFLPAAPLNPGGRLVPRLRVAALGVDPSPQWPVLADAAIGFDWPHLPLPAVPDAALSVDGPLQLPLLAAAAIGLDGPRLPLLPAAAFGIDGARRLPQLAADAIGLEEPRLPVLPAAALDLTVVDDEELRKLEEGLGLGLGLEGDRCWIQQPATHDGLPSITSSFLPRIFDLLEEVESVGYNIDDSTITEASMTLMVQMLDHMSERARMQILSNPALSVINQPPQDPTLSPPPQNRYPGTPPPQNRTTPPQSRYPGMWKSFITTVGLSVASNVLLYLLSTGIRLLEQTEQGSNIQNCAEPQSKETQNESWNKWVMKFIAWLTERVAAPVVLTWLVILVRESVIDNEKYMLKYEKNGTINVLINGISRAFFLGIRGFPGIHEADLWARLAAAAIDILGAAFLWWMGGHWDPDIADG